MNKRRYRRSIAKRDLFRLCRLYTRMGLAFRDVICCRGVLEYPRLKTFMNKKRTANRFIFYSDKYGN